MDDKNNIMSYDEMQTQPVSTQVVLTQPVLSKSVEIAVENYFDTMDEEAVTDLYEMVLSEVEAPLLSCVLRHTGNNQSRTAQILGLNRGTLRKKLKKYGML
ncbi:MAG: Fis family transcriptional regulator [Candidatus Azotimanducaceae bacterium]|jgi:Fis family transcriptional regulator